jgi:hypothetical protein
MGIPKKAGFQRHPADTGLTDVEFAPLNGLFNRILGKPVEPLVAKGLFGPDYGLERQLKLILAGLTEVPVGQVEIITSHGRLQYGMFAHITGKGFHGRLTPL